MFFEGFLTLARGTKNVQTLLHLLDEENLLCVEVFLHVW